MSYDRKEVDDFVYPEKDLSSFDGMTLEDFELDAPAGQGWGATIVADLKLNITDNKVEVLFTKVKDVKDVDVLMAEFEV